MSEEKIDLYLVTEVQRGNKQAFDAIVLKYQYKIFKIIARYISDPSEVLDVTQETFIKVYNALPSFRGDSAFYTWLYRVAINTAKNYIVAQGRKFPEINYEISDIEQYITDSNMKSYGVPERLIICDELENILFEALEELPSELKTAIMLREIEGLTYDEIASIMECPVGTVRSRLFRAREALEKQVQPLFKF